MTTPGWLSLVAAVLAAVAGLFGVWKAPKTRACRRCSGIGLTRGPRGRFTGACRVCRGSGQLDTWVSRVLTTLTRGRWLPPAGSTARGHTQSWQTVVFNGRDSRGRWRAKPDPPDTRLVGMERRIEWLERRLERREAARVRTRGPAVLWRVLLVWAARRALRKAESDRDDHVELLHDNAAGYRWREVERRR